MAERGRTRPPPATVPAEVPPHLYSLVMLAVAGTNLIMAAGYQSISRQYAVAAAGHETAVAG